MNKNNNYNGARNGKPAARSNGNGPKPAARAQARPTGSSRPKAVPGPARAGAGPQASLAAAYSSGQRSSAPVVQATRDQCRVVHRELLASVTGSAAYTVQRTLAMNPGLAASFPWLSTQAQNWERYRFNRLRFCYYTRTGSNVPGFVLLIPDYDASDAQPASEQIASTYEDVAEDAPWKDIECFCRPAAMHAIGPTKFVRSGALAANQDVKTYDAGNFFLATIDGTAVPWGKLWVEYDVTLFTPQTPPEGGGALAAQGLSAATPTSADFLPAPVTSALNSVALTTPSPGTETLVFNEAGRFLVVYTATGTTVTETAAPVGAAGLTFVAASNSSAGSGTAAYKFSAIVNVVVNSQLIFNNTIVAGLTANLLVAKVPSNFAA